MHRVLLVAFLLVSSFAFAQQEAAPVYDPDFEVELGLFNRFFTQDDAQGAYVHAQQLLDIANRKQMPPREVAAGEFCVGEALRKLQKPSEAEPHLRRALQLRQSVLPPTHYRVLQSVDALANVLFMQRKYDEAQPLLTRALGIYSGMSDLEGPDECARGIDLQHLGFIHLLKNDLTTADIMLTGASHSFVAAGFGCGQLHGIYNNLVTLYSAQNRRDKIEQVYKDAVKVFTPAPDEQPDYHYVFYSNALADLYVSEKRYADAETLLKRVIHDAGYVRAVDEGPLSELVANAEKQYKEVLAITGHNAAPQQSRK